MMWLHIADQEADCVQMNCSYMEILTTYLNFLPSVVSHIQIRSLKGGGKEVNSIMTETFEFFGGVVSVFAFRHNLPA